MLGVELATLLQTASFGTIDVNLFYNYMPPDPDVAMAVLQYPGQLDEPNLGEGGTLTRLEFPHFQLLTRGVRDDSNGPELRCVNGRKTLVAVINQSLSGVRYVGIEALTPPSPLMRDDDGRVYWSCNFRAIKVPSPS